MLVTTTEPSTDIIATVSSYTRVWEEITAVNVKLKCSIVRLVMT